MYHFIYYELVWIRKKADLAQFNYCIQTEIHLANQPYRINDSNFERKFCKRR
jgi:hypothetical protein